MFNPSMVFSILRLIVNTYDFVTNEINQLYGRFSYIYLSIIIVFLILHHISTGEKKSLYGAGIVFYMNIVIFLNRTFIYPELINYILFIPFVAILAFAVTSLKKQWN